MKQRLFLLLGPTLAITLLWATWQLVQAEQSPPILITAVYYDGYAHSDVDEAVQLSNVTSQTLDVSLWAIGDGGSGRTRLPAGTHLPAHTSIWLTRDADAFTTQFGFPPDFATEPHTTTIGHLSGSWPGYSNSGDEALLYDANDTLQDVVIYENGTATGDWLGLPVQPYQAGSLFGAEGQILQRKRDTTGRFLPDTNRASDWIQDPDDPHTGRRVAYPGWDSDAYRQPTTISTTYPITIAIAPDNAFQLVESVINTADSSIVLASLTFDHAALAHALANAQQRGVAVTLLLEGGPSGGLSDETRYACQQIETAGGACWFMINDSSQRIADRYRFMHAKYMLIDNEMVLLGSENWSPNSLPNDDKSDGTFGRRGVILQTREPEVIAYIQGLIAYDLDTANHADLQRWQSADPTYGAPPAGYQPITVTGGTTYTVRYADPIRIDDVTQITLLQAPDNNLTPDVGLFALLNQAAAGDTVLVQQLSERPYWGTSSSNATDDPNLRLAAYIAAARRGAHVRLMLDAQFDDADAPTSNSATCRAVRTLAQTEQLDIDCQIGNPTGLGIHNKMIVAEIDGRGYFHIGSWNGTEMSAKGNRELALQGQSDAAYALLAELFWGDWQYTTYMPLVFNQYRGRASHVLISELVYNPPGPDDAEFVELYNPTSDWVDLSGYGIGDAVLPTDFEDVRRIPAGTLISPYGVLVIATTATGFAATFGQLPDLEILPSHVDVPDLIDDPTWGSPNTFLQLGNSGDELLLRRPDNSVVDAIAYGTGQLVGEVACGLLPQPGFSFERYWPWQDSDSCPSDFRAWGFPSPGTVPTDE